MSEIYSIDHKALLCLYSHRPKRIETFTKGRVDAAQSSESISSPQESAAGMQNRPLADFSIRGHSGKCSPLIGLREHLLIGISPFNSRFSPIYVESLLVWGYKNFSKVDVLLPDEESAVILLLATGISAAKAVRKTRKELNRHRRSLARIVARLGEQAAQTRIIRFSDYFHHPKYNNLRSAVQNTCETCEKFRMACMDMSFQAIRGRANGVGSFIEELGEAHNVDIAFLTFLTKCHFI